MGFAVSAGWHYDSDWRFEFEGGYTGKYSNQADDVAFAMWAPYLTFNALYNTPEKTWGSFYVGPGLGIAFPTTKVSAGDMNVHFLEGEEVKREFSPILALLAGYQYSFTERFVLDLGYKLSTFSGTDHSRDFQLTGTPVQIHTFTNKTGWVLDNAFSIGVRYYF
jgi:opacity protein-like surface antigen